MDTLTPPVPRPLVAPRSRHRRPKGKRRGAPCKYPWHTLAVGQTYYIPWTADILFDSISHAVYRQNRINAERGNPARFALLDRMFDLPGEDDSPPRKAWALVRRSDAVSEAVSDG